MDNITDISEIENLAGNLAVLLDRAGEIDSPEAARIRARALAILQLNVVDVLQDQLSAHTLQSGPVFIDDAKDQAYGHFEKVTTLVGDENALWAFLTANDRDPNNYKRADITVIKQLLNEEEMLEGIEAFVGTDTSYSFGFKRNLTKRPRKSVQAAAAEVAASQVAKPRFKLGVNGVVSRAKVVQYTPASMVPPSSATTPSVMPPVRVGASA